MPLTPNYSIYYRDTSTPASLETESALQADSVDDALVAGFAKRQIQTFRWANATARGAQTGMVVDDIGYQADTALTYRYTGSAWVSWSSVWKTWTPTLTAGAGTFAVGNGTMTARYRYVQGDVQWKFRLVLGSTSTIGTNSSITLPVPAEATIPAFAIVARGTLGVTSGASLVDGIAYQSGGSQTVIVIGTYNVAGTYPTVVGVTAAIPFAWTTNYYIELDGTYRPA